MRTWTAPPAARPALINLIGQLGEPRFQSTLLEHLSRVIPAGSFSVYSLAGAAPQMYMSASLGMADTTADCWRAYLTGPCQSDQTLRPQPSGHAASTQLVHITALEVPPAHRAKVYDAHGMAERVSLVQRQRVAQVTGRQCLEDEGVLAINFYRHHHQRAFQDRHLADLADMAAELMALVQKQITLTNATAAAPFLNRTPLAEACARLAAIKAALTPREVEVCARLLQGMTQDGIAIDLGIKLTTVKTLRNRAFVRLGIHFRNELFARVMCDNSAI